MSKKKFTGVRFIETVRSGDKTIAFGIYKDAKIGTVPFAGVAEKNPEDADKPMRGRNLAIGRAFENLGKNIQKKEWKRIKPKQQKRELVITTVINETARKWAEEKAQRLAEIKPKDYFVEGYGRDGR